MKKLTYLLLTGTVFFLLETSLAFANDTPHNDDSAVACGDCHGEVLFSTDPADFSTPEELTDAYNAMCLRCHDDTSGSYHGTGAPAIANHDSDAVGGRFTFKTGCLDCHHPHAQDQLWDGRKYYGSEYRLLTGLGSKTGTLSSPTRTIITYNPASLSPKPGSEWDEADPEDSLVSLANKTSSGRGAMFMPNTNSPYNARIIESVDTAANTITVKGNVSSVSTAGFAIVLGQVIKKNLPYATASGFNTVFLDHTGTKSFAHNDGLGAGGTDSTVTGLCQVCHTQTNHWRNTPDAARDNHYGGTNCMNCHSHASGGFKPTYEDHYDVSSPYVTDYSNGGVAQSNETCISCHASSGTYKVDRDYVTDVHDSTCNNCHINFDSPPAMTGGANGSAVGRDGDNSCSDCHGTSGGFNYNTDFEGAHDVKDHSGLVGKTGTSIVTNCNYCHTDDIVNLDATPDVHNDNCFNCHTNTGNDGQLHTGNTGPSYSGVVSVGDASSHTVGTTSNCGECHATRASDFSSHDHSNATYHEVGGSVRTDSTVAQGAGDTSQNSAQQCSACHNTNGGGLTGWDDIYVEHNSDCNICHNATRDTSVSGSNSIGATIQTVIAANNNPTNCSACHRDKITSIAAAGSVHGDHKEEGWVRGAGTSCVGCHDQDNNDDHTQYITVIHKNDCALCHTNPGTGDYTLKAGSSAENHRVPEDGAENLCTTCHSVYNTDFDGGHQNEDHQSQALNDVLVGSTNCATTCHTIDVVNLDATPDVHNDNCALCHTNTGSDGRLTSGAKGDATGHTIDSTSECVDCHAAFDSDFQGEHGGGFNHTGVVTHPNCTTTCHPNSVAQTIAVTHTDCTSCHTNTSTDGTLVSGANGDATGHVVGTTSSCADCHTSYASDFQTAHGGGFNHTGVVVSSNCTTTCHSNSVAQTISVTHSDCTDCHTSTGPNGTLKDGVNNYGDASNHLIGSTSSCEDCHDISLGGPGTDFDGGSHADYDHDGVVGTSNATPVANCNGCHDGTTGPNIITNTHGSTCTECHSNTGANGELITGNDGYGDASGHALGSTSSCADCHNARNTSFESHTHGSNVYHETGGSLNTDTTVAQGAGDVSQETGTLCSACHRDLNGGSTTLTKWDEIAYEHDLDGTKDGVGSCVTCHNATRDVCIDGGKCATGVNTVQDIIAANGDPTNCAACHAAKIDSLSSDASHGYLPHDDDPNRTVVTYTGASGSGSDPDCKVCHDDGGNEVVYSSTSHTGDCAKCHAGVPNPLESTTTLATAMPDGGAGTDNGGGDCVDCHTLSYTVHNVNNPSQSTALHNNVSLTYAGTNDCDDCHGGAGSLNTWLEIISLHSDDCTLCHDSTNTDVVAAIQAGRSNSGGYTGGNSSVDCDSCHITNTEFIAATATASDAVTPMGHGTLAQYAYGEHDKFNGSNSTLPLDDPGLDCQACHTDMGTAQLKLTRHMGTDTTANCLTCHTTADDTSVSGGGTASAEGAIDDGKLAGNGNTQYCESCHIGKGAYTLHGMDDDSSDDDGIDSASADSGTDTVVSHNKLDGHSSGVTPSYTGNLNGSSALLATEYNCGDCHSGAIATKTFTTLRAMQVHTVNQGVGNGDCLTCHGFSGVSSIITSGVGGTSITCEDCHSTTVGNGPSGEKMYQYDGERHHKTAKAQAGDCTWCHADPRPATPTEGAWGSGAYNAYADTADSDGSGASDDATDGYITDYSTSTPAAPPTPAIPTQPACRLCHTNYESWSTDVYADQDGDTNYTEAVDVHGYHLQAQTADYNDTGLTVYANDYSPLTVDEAGGSYPSGTMNRGVRGVVQVAQSEIHRIEPNTGTTKIVVQDFGACFTCHSVQIFHAAPNSDAPWSDYTAASNTDDVPYDTLRYAPGRSIFNLLPGSNCGDQGSSEGNNNDSWDQHCEPEKFNSKTWDNERGRDLMDDFFNKQPSNTPANNGKFFDVYNTANWTQADVPGHSGFSNFESLPGISTTGTLYSGHGGGVPVFTNYPTLPTVDDIIITLAEWDGTDVNVKVYNSEGSGQTMRLTYSGGACTNAPVDLTWVTDHYEGTCTNPGSYTEGTDTVTLSNTTTSSALDIRTRLVADNSGPVATVANDDSYTVAISATTQLLVMSNDTGTNNTILSTDDTNLNGNCSTAVAGGGTRVDITCGATTGAMGTFDYVVQGDANSDTGTVTITSSANAAPTLSISEPSGQTDVTVGSSFDITYTLADSDDVVTAAMYMDDDNTGYDGDETAIGTCAAVAEGTDQTCAWDTSAATGGSTYYIYGVTDDGTNPAVEAYSGSITFATCGTLATASWTELYNGATPPTTDTYTVVNDTDGTARLFVLGVYVESSGNATLSVTAAMGGQNFTEITSNKGVSSRSNTWLGYINEAQIAARSNDNLTFTINSGTETGVRIYLKEFTYVNQTYPVRASDTNQDTTDTNQTSLSISSMPYSTDDQLIALGAHRDGSTIEWSGSITGELEDATNPTSEVAYKTIAADGSEVVTINGFTGRYPSLSGAVIQSECNEIAPPVTLNGSWSGASDTTAGNTITYSYGAPAGSNRMMIVVVTHEDTGPETISGVTYNGSPVNVITSQASGSGFAWIGYQLLGTGAAVPANNVQATFTNNVTASRIMVATYDNANQGAPTNFNQQATTNNPSMAVNNLEGGRVIYGVYFNNTNTINPPGGWTEHDDTTVDTGGWGATQFRMGVGDRDATSAGSVTVNPTSSGGSNPTILVGVSIDPM